MWDPICPTFTNVHLCPFDTAAFLLFLFCPVKCLSETPPDVAPKPNLSSALARSASTPLSTCKRRFGPLFTVTLRSASTNLQIPIGFLQQTIQQTGKTGSRQAGRQSQAHANRTRCRAVGFPATSSQQNNPDGPIIKS